VSSSKQNFGGERLELGSSSQFSVVVPRLTLIDDAVLLAEERITSDTSVISSGSNWKQ